MLHSLQYIAPFSAGHYKSMHVLVLFNMEKQPLWHVANTLFKGYIVSTDKLQTRAYTGQISFE